MDIGKTIHVTTAKQWRTWLSKNASKATEIWLICPKKNSGKPGIPYIEAVEEALCFGWIDSQIKGIDDKTYAQRFSPRRPKSNWTATNIELVHQLIKQGRMTKAGLAVAPTEK